MYSFGFKTPSVIGVKISFIPSLSGVKAIGIQT